MKHRTEGHTETSISGDTRADWSDAFALVPNLEVAYVWHASKFTRSCPGQRQCARRTTPARHATSGDRDAPRLRVHEKPGRTPGVA
jgi:hypothetical protein